MTWKVVERAPPPDDPVWRRFGRIHEKPCRKPGVITCALWECQQADECQADECQAGDVIPLPDLSREVVT